MWWWCGFFSFVSMAFQYVDLLHWSRCTCYFVCFYIINALWSTNSRNFSNLRTKWRTIDIIWLGFVLIRSFCIHINSITLPSLICGFALCFYRLMTTFHWSYNEKLNFDRFFLSFFLSIGVYEMLQTHMGTTQRSGCYFRLFISWPGRK